VIDVAQVKAKYDLARSKKDQVQDELIQALEYTNPAAAPNRVNDSLPNRFVCYDNTAEDAAVTLSNMLVSYLVPTDQKWAQLVLSPSVDPAKFPVDQINRVLELQTRKFFAEIANSDFYLGVSDAVSTMVRVGSGCLAIEVNAERGLNYYSVPVNELFYLDDGCGCPDTVFRKHKVPARSVVDWYQKDGTVPDSILRMAEKEPEREVELIEAMLPGDGKSERDRYCYAVYVGEGWDCVYEKGLSFRNLIVFRWDRTYSMTWGDSPIRRALPAIRVLNMLAKFMLASGEFASQGAWVSSDESLRDQQMIPGTVMYSANPNELAPIQFSGNWTVSKDLLESYQSEIRAMCFADALPPASASARYTSDEIDQRQKSFFMKIGTVAHRLEHELLRPLIVQSIRALQSIGRMDPIQFGNHALDIENNPFVRVDTRSLVKRVQAAAEMQQIAQGVQMVGQVMGQNAVALIDTNALARHMLSLSGIPASMIKSEQQVKQEQAAMNAAQALGGMQAAQQGQGGNPEMAQATGKAVAGLAQAAQQNPGAIQAIMGAMQGGPR
jgi:hypothetical protein